MFISIMNLSIQDEVTILFLFTLWMHHYFYSIGCWHYRSTIMISLRGFYSLIVKTNRNCFQFIRVFFFLNKTNNKKISFNYRPCIWRSRRTSGNPWWPNSSNHQRNPYLIDRIEEVLLADRFSSITNCKQTYSVSGESTTYQPLYKPNEFQHL